MVERRRLTELEAFELSHNWDEDYAEARLSVLGVVLARAVQVKVFETLYPDAASVDDASGWRNLLKLYGVDWRAKFLHSKLALPKHSSSNDIWAIFDVNNTACIDVLNAASQVLSKRIGRVSALCLDPSIDSQVDPSLGRLGWTSEFRWRHLLQAVRSTRELSRSFRRRVPEFRDRMLSAGADEAAVDKVMSKFGRQISDLAREIIAWDALLDRHKPKLILLSNDAHRAPRILTALAQSKSIPVVSLQHGLPVWLYGYVPVFADLLLVWGRTSEDWFTSRGVPPERMVRIGDLRTGRHLVKRETNPTSANCRRLIWMPNPVSRHINELMGSVFFRLADEFGLPVIIKLHPSEKDRSWFESLVPVRYRDATAISSCAIGELKLQSGDLVVVGNSTVGIEAVMFGAFIINLRCNSLPNPVDYASHGIGVTLDCPADDLSEIVPSIRTAMGQVSEQSRERFLGSVFEDMSENAAERLATVAAGVLERRSGPKSSEFE